MESGVGSLSTDYALLPHSRPSDPNSLILRTAGPLILAIAGSALTPLPCAFALTGVPTGLAALGLIAFANLYTTKIMVRSAARLGTSGYEEVVEAAGGETGLRLCQAALFLLLFGSACTCLCVIQETATRAVAELAPKHNAARDALAHWLVGTPAGQATLLTSLTAFLLLPLSLASMGELFVVSLLGVAMMIVLCIYVLYLSFASKDGASNLWGAFAVGAEPPGQSSLALRLPTAASTFGYAFYIQPCALPLLRNLPPGEAGSEVLTQALDVTFVFTAAAYLIVGIGGLAVFGQGNVPQDLLQGFRGHFAGALSGFFCLYLCLCFPPIIVPLREILVRLVRRRGLQPTPRRRRVADASTVTLPPLQNAALTSLLVGGALLVALLLPDASATLFALTGATGVCCVSYLLPIFCYWSLDEAEGGVRRSASSGRLASKATPVASDRRGGGPGGTGQMLRLRRLAADGGTWAVERAWPTTVLVLGLAVSALTLVGVAEGLGGSASC